MGRHAAAYCDRIASECRSVSSNSASASDPRERASLREEAPPPIAFAMQMMSGNNVEMLNCPQTSRPAHTRLDFVDDEHDSMPDRKCGGVRAEVP